jgi:hypothetical protein
MIGGQDDGIVQSLSVEHLEESAEAPIEREHLEAHLGATGPEGVADVIGCRQADRNKVGRAVLAEPEFLNEAAGKGEDCSVIFRRNAEAAGIACSSSKRAGSHRKGRRQRIGGRLSLAERRHGQRLPGHGNGTGNSGVRASNSRRYGCTGHIGRELLPVPVPALVHDMTAHHDGGAILPGYSDVFALRPPLLHQVAEGRHSQMYR